MSTHHDERGRVLVTGIGLETCIGRDVKTFWQSLSEGRSGIRPVTAFDPGDLPCKIAGEVDFTPEDVMTRTEIRRTSRQVQMLLSAAVRAVDDAGSPALGRAALVVGSGGGGGPTLAGIVEAIGPERAPDDPFLLMKTLPNMPATHVAERFGITGPVLTVTTACAASTDAIGMALAMLRSGIVDIALVGGVETWLTRGTIASFVKVRAVSKRHPDEATSASRPFDLDRDGMVPAEGAAVLVLEREEHLATRPARTPYGVLLGAASNCDAHHPVQPRLDGTIAADVIRIALRDARLEPEDVDLVSAHGTSTKLNDVVETRAIRAAFGTRSAAIPITAPKSVTGHASGACGVIEAAGALLALENGFVPPTANLVTPDPECDLDFTPLEGRAHDAQVAVSCNFGFGGQNAAVVLGRFDG